MAGIGIRKVNQKWWRRHIPILLIAALPLPVLAGSPYWIQDANTSQRYRIEPLRDFTFVYVDRDYVFTEVPNCLAGNDFIATASADKFSRQPELVVLRSEVPLAVYVGYDRRYRSTPDWLNRFEKVPDLRLAVGDPKLGKSEVSYEVYRAIFPPGRIELGGNLAKDEESNFATYTAILVEASRDRCR